MQVTAAKRAQEEAAAAQKKVHDGHHPVILNHVLAEYRAVTR
jgi:hypothetical protein